MNKSDWNLLSSNKKHTNLCFLIKDDKVLLAMKKRGFGKGRWNGVGGKSQGNETPEQAVIREAEEEIGVRVKNLESVAILHFMFIGLPIGSDWDQKCYVYFTSDWESKPTESEEMKPKWFKKSKLPLDVMWPDDYLWLPRVLNGEKLTAKFEFDADQNILDYVIDTGLIE